MNNKHLLFIILFSGFFVNAQNIVLKGKVRNKENSAVHNVSIVIYVNKTIGGYDYTNNEGNYTIKLKDLKLRDSLNITIKGLGYESISRKSIFNGQQEIIQDFILEEKAEMLNEVVLEAWEKIKIRTDTVTFRASKFMKGSEQVVEDLLKNLPGVEVLKNGNIKVNGKPIDKLLIEGDDLFDDKYKLLSKNLDAKNISEVQILNNFEDNPVLRDFQESEKVAINLKLKKDRKNVWFGNASVGIGTNSRHTGSTNLGLIKQKFKFFNLMSLNNTRRLAVSQVKNSGSGNTSSLQTQEKIEKDNNTIANSEASTNSTMSLFQ